VEHADLSGLCRLPGPEHLPVVVAARMSLSFPFLFRAVPLHSVDYSLNLKAGEGFKPERTWFLDGGICSNFPIDLFDAPLPGRPTFGVNLQPLREDRPEQKVWMPERNNSGFGEQWTRFSRGRSLGPILAWAFGMIDAARN
jgi:predicted acylesterase/phospholipase RssA